MKAYAAIAFLASAFSGGRLIRPLSVVPSPGALPGICVLVLLLASALLFAKPRFGYLVGFLSATIALYWFSRIELGNFPALNSWILFNLRDTVPSLDQAQLRITFAAALI